ncbi:hypothetical protein Hypma_013761 [Hypsizygus marmoreus]|uniref:Uncharacterized protein n=1 Tax=Hypsizygus marmoreus TaxID=39966 RepID=A0A369KA93_HYPMA|nr:hypothetical protein Hypma_013761 [Hypsizygus marmoreus]
MPCARSHPQALWRLRRDACYNAVSLACDSTAAAQATQHEKMERKTRSGHGFSPYNCFDTPIQDSEVVAVAMEFNDLIDLALTLEKTRLDTIADDTEGIPITSKPTTRKSDKSINKRTHAIAGAPPPASHGGIEKRRRTDYRKTNRRGRRVAVAQSGSSAENYRPLRSTVEAQNSVPVINAFVDARELPTTQKLQEDRQSLLSGARDS